MPSIATTTIITRTMGFSTSKKMEEIEVGDIIWEWNNRNFEVAGILTNRRQTKRFGQLRRYIHIFDFQELKELSFCLQNKVLYYLDDEFKKVA